MKTGVTIMVVGAVLVAAPAASAKPSPRVARLEHRLHQMTVGRDTVRAELAAASAQVSTVQAQLAGVQSTAASLASTLAQRTAERDAARAQAARLQAQLAAIPSPLTVAVDAVQHEVAYSEQVLAAAGVTVSRDELVARAALDYTVGHVNAAAYGYLTVIAGEPVSPTPDAVLAAQAGICGDAALVYAAIVKRFGLEVRSVQFYYGPGGAWNHIADEVSYAGGWHYFDPTYGLYFEQDGNVESIDEARIAESVPVQDASLFWLNVTRAAGNVELADTGFETDPATSVVLDGQPFVG